MSSPSEGRKGKHYVLSPDPRDSIGLSELRSVTMSWVRENFADYEVVIVYHDDNEGHIPHAHVVVNNTNLDTGRRLQDPDPGGLNGSFQRMAREAGMSHFIGRIDGQSRDESHYRRRAIDRPESSLSTRGAYSWVADIRMRVEVARGIARNPDDFRSALEEMGVTLNVRMVHLVTLGSGTQVDHLVDFLRNTRSGNAAVHSSGLSDISTRCPRPPSKGQRAEAAGIREGRVCAGGRTPS